MTIWIPDLAARSGPKSQAIVDALAGDIAAGRLKPGTRLPTHRELADRLGVALGTVTRAYALAQRRGLVSGEIGRGTFVGGGAASARASAAGEAEESGQADLSRNLITRAPHDPDLPASLAALGDQFQLNRLLDLYQSAAGAWHHREAAARWLSRAGFEARADQVLVCSGAQHALSVVLATLTEPGDLVVTEQVTYPGVKALASLLHLRLRGLPVDEHGLVPEAFAEACASARVKALYCVPTLQNPTSSIMPEARRRELAAVAETHNVAIVEDDVYGFLLPGAPPPVTSFAPAHGYFVTSTSKLIAPGLRIGYAAAPAQAVERLATTIRATQWEAAPLMAELVTNWIGDGTIERVAHWKRAEMEARAAIARQLFGDKLAPTAPTSSHLWLRLPEPWRGADFVNEASARGVRLSPTDSFAVGRGDAPHAVRLCLGASPHRHMLEGALTTLAEILQGAPEPALTGP